MLVGFFSKGGNYSAFFGIEFSLLIVPIPQLFTKNLATLGCITNPYYFILAGKIGPGTQSVKLQQMPISTLLMPRLYAN